MGCTKKESTEKILTNSNLSCDYIEELLMKDEKIHRAVEITNHNNFITKNIVDKIFLEITDLINDKNIDFDIRNGFQALGECINYLCQLMCGSYEEFQDELTVVHNLLAKNFEEMTSSSEMEKFPLRRVMMLSGSIIDYVFWKEALGDYLEGSTEKKS